MAGKGSHIAASEGYVLASYGPERYLRHAVASATTIRRHDPDRPIALYCPPEHRAVLERHGIGNLFQRIEHLPEEHRSIVGFKHHLHRFMPFEQNLFLDSDMVWCRNPDPLWNRFREYGFTATGLEQADIWFGAPKGPRALLDVARGRRDRTLKRFNIPHLPRVQSGMMIARDRDLTQQVCEAAQAFLARQDETHFQSRLRERGRTLESCEWSLAVAMASLDVPVFPWRQEAESPQVDFFAAATEYGEDFTHVRYRYFSDRFVHELQSIEQRPLRELLLALARLTGRGEHIYIEPYVLHFGWLHQKQPFLDFAERTWRRLTTSR